MSQKKYIIFNATEISAFDFSSIPDDQWYPFTDESLLRRDSTGEKIFVGWNDGQPDPPYVEMLQTKEGPYTKEQLMSIITTGNWIAAVSQ